MKLKLDKNRRLLAVETPEFRITLNGRETQAYKDILAPLGITLDLEDVDATPVELTPQGKLGEKAE